MLKRSSSRNVLHLPQVWRARLEPFLPTMRLRVELVPVHISVSYSVHFAGILLWFLQGSDQVPSVSLLQPTGLVRLASLHFATLYDVCMDCLYICFRGTFECYWHMFMVINSSLLLSKSFAQPACRWHQFLMQEIILYSVHRLYHCYSTILRKYILMYVSKHSNALMCTYRIQSTLSKSRTYFYLNALDWTTTDMQNNCTIQPYFPIKNKIFNNPSFRGS